MTAATIVAKRLARKYFAPDLAPPFPPLKQHTRTLKRIPLRLLQQSPVNHVSFAIQGVRGIYKGYAATLLSFGPFSAFYFAIYEALKVRISNKDEVASSRATLACASFAGGSAAFITSPLDLAKFRMQIERRKASSSPALVPEYTSFLRSIVHIHRHEGTRGLWRGSVARVVFTAPNTAITMCVFEQTKGLLGERQSRAGAS